MSWQYEINIMNKTFKQRFHCLHNTCQKVNKNSDFLSANNVDYRLHKWQK